MAENVAQVDSILPELVDSRSLRRMPLREPEYILEARRKAELKKQSKDKDGQGRKRKTDTGNKNEQSSKKTKK